MNKDVNKKTDNNENKNPKKLDVDSLAAKICLSFCALLVVSFISLCISFAVEGYKESSSDSSSSSDSWNETYSKCIVCGVKKQRKYLYGSLCGKCYQAIQNEMD